MVLFFTSPIGLGHASRDIAIANKLSSNFQQENISITFISGSHAFKMISNYGYKGFNLYDPPKFNVNTGKLNNSFIWLIKYLTYYKKCKKISQKIISDDNNKKEDIIISDEDFASITVGEKNNKKRILVTDILATNFTRGAISFIEKKMNKELCRLINKCNVVIVPDYGKDRDNIHHVGPIVREIKKNREKLREEFGFNRKTILVCVGGTNSGRHLIEKTMEVYRKIKNRLDLDLVIISGPSINIILDKEENNKDKCIRVINYVDNLHEYIFASDVVISLAGRSTMDESIVYGTPGIFIPIKNHFEQENGAKRLGFKYEDIYRLDSLIEDKLNFKNSNKNKVSNGVDKAVKLIMEWL